MTKPVIEPAVLTGSEMRFYQPPTIQSDYTNLLYTDHPHFTETFEQVQDWIARAGGGDPVYMRATYFPVDWKSKVGNSDASANFKTDWQTIIRKGDIVIRDTGEILMLTWDIKEHMNNQASQAQICNLNLTLRRKVRAKADRRGFVTVPEYDEIVLYEHPATMTPYAGRPDYASSAGTPGINPDSLMTCQAQFNEKTKLMEINDEFVHGGFTYRIIDINWTEVDYACSHGIVNFHCKRVAGGMV